MEGEILPEICIEIVRLLTKSDKKLFFVLLQQSYGSFHHDVVSRTSQDGGEVSGFYTVRSSTHMGLLDEREVRGLHGYT